jgi:hypothetical protein
VSSLRIVLLALAIPLLQGLSAVPGLYIFEGRGAREWNVYGLLDNYGQTFAHKDMFSSLFLTDILQNPGSIFLKEGTFTARWLHAIRLIYNYQPLADKRQASSVDGDSQIVKKVQLHYAAPTSVW